MRGRRVKKERAYVHAALEIKKQEPAELMNRWLQKFYSDVKDKYDVPTLPPCKFFHVNIINIL